MEQPEVTIERIARTFPSLGHIPILNRTGQFRPREFLERVAATGAGRGASHAARFIADVWEGGRDSDRPDHFDLFAALGAWDAAHKAAFMAWVQDPVWP